jgi:hypothetical protein
MIRELHHERTQQLFLIHQAPRVMHHYQFAGNFVRIFFVPSQ